jgi:hypothetical protein
MFPFNVTDVLVEAAPLGPFDVSDGQVVAVPLEHITGVPS